jgi:class 3 adenylate cyclase
VMGDGIMALFGAPLAHEDHPRAGLLRGAQDEGFGRAARGGYLAASKADEPTSANHALELLGLPLLHLHWFALSLKRAWAITEAAIFAIVDHRNRPPLCVHRESRPFL